MNSQPSAHDAEYAYSRGEGLEASCPQVLLALACFFVAMLWSLTAGAWIRLGRRIFCPGKECVRRDAEHGTPEACAPQTAILVPIHPEGTNDIFAKTTRNPQFETRNFSQM